MLLARRLLLLSVSALSVAALLVISPLVVAQPPHSSSGSGSGAWHRAPHAGTPVDPATLVTVPAVVGLRVGAARRALLAAGLRMRAIDADAEVPIAPEVYGYYRVESSSVTAGTQVPRGTVVRLLGRDPNADLGEGY